jgi:hypothetical protein
VEVARIQAWVDFDDRRRVKAARQAEVADPALAVFIDRQRLNRQRVNDRIRDTLHNIYCTSGYKGTVPDSGAFGEMFEEEGDDDGDMHADNQPAGAEEEDEMIRLSQVMVEVL